MGENKFLFLIGTHRSGTTWTGKLLGQSDEFAYWVEPRQVWSYGNYKKTNDLLERDDATQKIKSHIRKRFETYAKRQGKKRFIEKTPSNCLRIPFMHEVFPDGKFILIIRDGRAVFRSTQEIKETKTADWNRIWSRIRESSLKEMPAYFDRIPWLFRKLTGRKLNFWGVKPPGWENWLSNKSSNEMIALQWAHTISVAFEKFHSLPEHKRLLVRYEDMLTDTKAQVQRLAEFAEIRDHGRLTEVAMKSVNRGSNSKWRNELSPELLDEIRPIMQPTLNALGYEW